MLDAADTIQDTLNLAGGLATAAALEHFDTDGRPIDVTGPSSFAGRPENLPYRNLAAQPAGAGLDGRRADSAQFS
jgi:hypothetical protein